MSNKKNLLIYAHYYIPDTASTGQILRELAEGMLDKFNITVICVVPSYLGTIEDKYKTQKYYEEEINGVKVLRIRVPEFSKTNKKSPQATVSIAVIGKTDVQALLYHELLQTLNVGGASIVVDVQTVGLCIDDIGICTESIENRLGDIPAGAVGTVQTDLDALKGVDTEADQIAHVAVTTRNIVHRAANVFPVSERQLRPVLIEHMELSVDVVLN